MHTHVFDERFQMENKPTQPGSLPVGLRVILLPLWWLMSLLMLLVAILGLITIVVGVISLFVEGGFAGMHLGGEAVRTTTQKLLFTAFGLALCISGIVFWWLRQRGYVVAAVIVWALLGICYWGYWGWQSSQLQHEYTALVGHLDGVYSVAFSPDGKVLASSDSDTVKLWDVATGKEIKTLAAQRDVGQGKGLSQVAFSPDGNTLAFLGYLKPKVRLWDMATTKERGVLGSDGAVIAMAFRPDGRLLALGSHSHDFKNPRNSRISLWDMATGEEVIRLDPAFQVVCLAFAPDGKTLAAAGIKMVLLEKGGAQDVAEVKLWDVDTRKALHTITDIVGPVRSIVFRPDGKLLAVGNYTTMDLWDVATGEARASSRRHSSMVFSPDGVPASLGGHIGMVTSLAFSPDGELLASGSADRTVLLWDVDGVSNLDTFRGHTGAVTSVAISPDGERLASGSDDKTIRLWNIAAFKGRNRGRSR
jgi:WD40 repeat protein